MDFLNRILRAALEGYGSLFGDAHPMLSLAPLSVLAGIGMLWVFGKTSNQKAIEHAKKKMQAYLLELRLYGDDPRLLWRAQKNLVTSNLRYMGLMLVPALYLTLPMVILLFHLDAYYGRAALPAGEPAVVTLQANGRIATRTPAPELNAPENVALETPPVRALEAGQFSWRVRPTAAGKGVLRFEWDGNRFEKEIVVGEGHSYLNARRVRSFWAAIADPGEPRLDVEFVRWVETPYPGKTIEFLGLDWHWLIWFLLISIVSAYLLKGFFGVVI